MGSLVSKSFTCTTTAPERSLQESSRETVKVSLNWRPGWLQRSSYPRESQARQLQACRSCWEEEEPRVQICAGARRGHGYQPVSLGSCPSRGRGRQKRPPGTGLHCPERVNPSQWAPPAGPNLSGQKQGGRKVLVPPTK